MNTENTETIKGWVFYDAECAICRGWVNRAYALVVRRGYHFVPLQANWAKTRLGLKSGEPLKEMKLLTAQGDILDGADALDLISGTIWWLWPVYAFGQIPGVKPLLRILYRRLAANRHCFGNHCKLVDRHAEHSGAITRAFFELP